MSTIHRVDPRVRALGKARIDVIQRARDEQEFQNLWLEARHPFPFSWGQGWKHSIQYFVDDYPAEVGFFIDVLGFPVNTFSASYAQFTSPEQDFYFTIAAKPGDGPATPAESLRLQFQLSNLSEVIRELEARGVICEQPESVNRGRAPFASFRTPHGVLVELIGQVELFEDEESVVDETPVAEPTGTATPIESFWAADEWDEDEELSDDEIEEVEEAEEEILPVLRAKKEGPAAVIEVTYEDIVEKEDGEPDDEYEDEEPTPIQREPVPSLSGRSRDAHNPQRSRQPSTHLRQLDIPIEPNTLIRNRRTRRDGAVIFPVREDRDQRRDD